MPETFSSLLSSLIFSKTVFSSTVSGYLIISDLRPISTADFSLFRTYILLGAYSPISITVKPGTLLNFFLRLSTSFFKFDLKSAAVFFSVYYSHFKLKN